MLDLLLSPIKAYFSLFTALALPHYLPLFSSQTYSTRRSVAGEVARSILKNRIKITTSEHLEGVLSLLKVLIKEGIQHSGGYPGLSNRSRGSETDETLEEQGWLARIVHLIQGPDNDTQLKVSCRLTLLWDSVLTMRSSSYNRRAKPTKPVMNESSTPPLPSLPHCSNLPASTSRANTSKTIGPPSPPASTVSSTKHSFSCIPASLQQRRSFAFGCSSPAGKLPTSVASRKLLTSSSSKPSPFTKIALVIAERNSRPCVSWQVHSRAREDLGRRITTP